MSFGKTKTDICYASRHRLQSVQFFLNVLTSVGAQNSAHCEYSGEYFVPTKNCFRRIYLAVILELWKDLLGFHDGKIPVSLNFFQVPLVLCKACCLLHFYMERKMLHQELICGWKRVSRCDFSGTLYVPNQYAPCLNLHPKADSKTTWTKSRENIYLWNGIYTVPLERRKSLPIILQMVGLTARRVGWTTSRTSWT